MRKLLHQKTVDERIHQFLARRAEKQLSDRIAKFFVPEEDAASRAASAMTGITYERIDWPTQTAAMSH